MPGCGELGLRGAAAGRGRIGVGADGAVRGDGRIDERAEEMVPAGSREPL